MSKPDNKIKSLLSYIQNVNPPLYKLIKNLGMQGTLMSPTDNSGVTFLNPSEKLTNELIKMPKDNQIDKVKYISALFLQMYLDTPTKFEEATDIPTGLFQKLGVSGVDRNSVSLSSGGTLTPNTTIGNNIAVYNLEGKLVPIDGESSAYTADEKPNLPAMTGGFDYKNKGATRRSVFETVLDCYCNCKNGEHDGGNKHQRDPAMELLVALALYFKKANPSLYDCITSLLSNDTMSSLAIVLQPYRDSSTYITDAEYAEFAEKNTDASNTKYCYIDNPSYVYKAMMKNSASTYSSSLKDICEARTNVIKNVNKPTIVASMSKFFDNLNKFKLPELRKNVLQSSSKKLLFCEAELRVIASIANDNSNGSISHDELQNIYKKYNLNEPHILSSQNVINELNIAYYYSAVWAMLRSDAIFYMAGISTMASAKTLSSDHNAIVNDKTIINFNDGFTLVSDDAYANNSSNVALQMEAAKDFK